MGQSNKEPLNIATQLTRWRIFLEKREIALKEDRECLVLGDMNLDFIRWTKSNLPPNDSGHKVKPMKDILFSQIYPYGVTQLVTKATSVSP